MYLMIQRLLNYKFLLVTVLRFILCIMVVTICEVLCKIEVCSEYCVAKPNPPGAMGSVWLLLYITADWKVYILVRH